MCHKYVGFSEFANYREWDKFAAYIGHPKPEKFSASGEFTCNPGPCWGLGSQTPVIGSHSKCEPTPNFLTGDTPGSTFFCKFAAPDIYQ